MKLHTHPAHGVMVPRSNWRRHPERGWIVGSRPPTIKRDVRTLHIAKYMPAGLAQPASPVSYSKQVTIDIGMDGNDVYGDCVVAAADHGGIGWRANAGRPQTKATDQQILDAYFTVSGGQDVGLWPIDWLNFWKKTGLAGDKIEAFGSADAGNVGQMEVCISCLEGHFMGLALPDTNTFGPWDVLNPKWAPNPANGHMVWGIDFDRDARLVWVWTWGGLFPMSYDFFFKYNDEGYGVGNDLSTKVATGKTPLGLDLAALLYDAQHIKDPITPIVVPPDPVPPSPPAPAPTGQMVPVFTQRATTNLIVSKDGVNQTPTHTSPFEAAEHAGRLKLANPGSVIEIISAGDVECTLEALS